MFKKILTYLLIGYIVLGFTLFLIKIPVTAAHWFMPFTVETPHYMPIQVNQKYAKIVSYDKVKMIYENPNESVIVWATSHIGWNNISNWDERLHLPDGTTAYYTEHNNMQIISWRRDQVEYAIDYEGPQKISQQELVNIASSIHMRDSHPETFRP